MTDSRETVREYCEQMGISWARAHLPDMTPGDDQRTVREWIDEYETKERTDLEARQLKLAIESIAAAKTSAEASLESARHAKDSVKATRVAGLFALIAAVAAIGQAVAAFKG